MDTEIIACTRVCKKCGIAKPIEEYGKRSNSTYRNGRIPLCPPCQREWRRDYYYKNKDKWSNYKKLPRVKERSRQWRAAMSVEARNSKLTKERYRQLWAKYGITADEYDRLLDIQDGCCAICRKKPDSNLYVDHDHRTAKVRGLLCVRCNTAIGQLGDDVHGLMKAVDYLQNPPAESAVKSNY